MIRARVTSTWSPHAEQQILDQAMSNLLKRARQAVPSVECPTHNAAHRVIWTRTKEGLGASVEEPCCEAVQGELEAAIQRAMR
jgi:hypothetical protein